MSTPVEQIKERLDIVEVLSSYIKLDKSGQNYKAKCPFHGEKTPSFMVSPLRQSFYCFGCQASGDIFTFVERFEGLDFRGALKFLADKAGVELKERKPEQEEKQEVLAQIMEKSTLFFENKLKENPLAFDYIKKRGISEDVIKKWRIGFAPDAWRNLHDFLLGEGLKKEDILSAGMIKKVDGQDKYYDTFRNRIMFPIFDSSGRVIAFSGRSLSDDPKSPKYLNSPETPLFKKSEVLYGLNFAKASIRLLDYSVLVEGQMDLVLSHEAGVLNTVASSGTALTDLHLKRLQKISNRIILAYDGDEAGVKASKRSLELGLLLGMEVKIAKLPKGEDPASISQKDPKEWKDILRDADDGIIFCLKEVMKNNLSGITLAKKINNEILPFIGILQNEMIKSQYVKMISKETGIPEQAIVLEISRLSSRVISSSGGQTNQENAILNNIFLSPEEMLVGYILLTDDTEIKNKLVALLGETVFEEIMENGVIDKSALTFEAERIFSVGDGGGGKSMALDLLKRIEQKILKREFEKIALKLDKEIDDDKKKILEREMMEKASQLSKLSV